MLIKNFLIENKNVLGKFRDNGKKGAKDYWEFSHLVGYVIFPSINWDEGCMTIDKKSKASCVVIYSNLAQPQIVIISYSELKLLGDYTDISNLSKSDQSKINKINSKQGVSSSKIEGFVREQIKIHIESYRRDIDRLCKKWPIRDKFLKAIEKFENNIDQLYILKTDFYEKS